MVRVVNVASCVIAIETRIESRSNKISNGRGNFLRNKVRCWVGLDSPEPLNLSLPAERKLNTLPR